MKTFVSKTGVLLVSALLLSCVHNDDLCCGPDMPLEGPLIGEWLLYESGWSIGSGYDVTAIPAEPAQKFIFTNNRKFTTTMAMADAPKFFRVLDDPNSELNILAFI